jgi:arabinofuranosyltransferase
VTIPSLSVPRAEVAGSIEPRRPRAWLLALCVILLGIAWMHRFVQDDAYIVLRYARHLAAGDGLVWNIGERVEGYSSFLHTVLMAAPFLLGVDPVAAAHALGLACFAGSLVATFAAARWTFGAEKPALLAVALLGTNYTFSVFATGGLETSLHAFLICVGLWLVARGQARGWMVSALLVLSVVGGLLLLTRPDSAVPVALLFAMTLWRLHRGGALGWRPVAALTAPAAAVVGVWLAWKLSYYGELLPNTYYVKVASPTSLYNGVRYLYLFGLSYGLLPLALLAIPLVPRLRRDPRDALSVSIGFVVLWLAYLLRIGGDFMEFRLLVPILPSLMLLIVWAIVTIPAGPAVRAGLVALVLLGSLHHALVFNRWPRGQGPESRRDLEGHLFSPVELGRDRPGAGQRGGRGPVGGDRGERGRRDPYYSELPAIDMIGLTDWWVARHGDRMGTWPGHQRVAPYHYLVQRGAHLLIGHPVLRHASLPRVEAYPFEYVRGLILPGADPRTLPVTTRVVEMPVEHGYYLPILYVRSHPIVDDLLARGAWREARLAR